MTGLRIEISKFAVVGAGNFVLTFVIFALLLNKLHVNHIVSLGTAWLFGMFFSYVVNFVWVFRPTDKLTFDSRFTKFLIVGIVSVALNMIALQCLVDATAFDPFYLQFALIPLVVAFNFSAAKFWSLR